MKIRFSDADIQQTKVPVLVIGAFKDVKKPEGALKKLDEASGGWIARVLSSGDFKGKKGEVLVQQTFDALPCDRVMLLGLGEPEKWSVEQWRRSIGIAAKKCRALGVKQFGVGLELPSESAVTEDDLVSGAVEGALLALYRFLPYKTENNDNNSEIEEMVLVPKEGKAGDSMRKLAREAEIVAGAANWARDLISHPSNNMTPTLLADAAAQTAEEQGIRCTVYDKEAIEEKGMGGLLGVASGSKEPPRLIVMEYQTEEKDAPKVVLVGKGITFDTGGISIKPAAKMDQMKHDMAGGAAVLGAVRAAAELKLPVNVIGIVPATENMPSGSAYKPGDVLKTMSGKTIEVINTDAEGRVVLADGLALADSFEPDAVIDLATLTGACVVALGDQMAGLMGTDSDLIEKLRSAGECTGETVWPLPLKEEYEEQIKSDIADVKNSGGRDAGAITAGLFLKKFVKCASWAHMDIAGPCWTDKERPYHPKGATGFGVRLLISYLKALK